MATETLSAGERALFDETVALCRTLRASKKLCSGVEFFINEQGVIKFRPATPVLQPGEPMPDIEKVVRDALGAFHELREWLANMFDIESAIWNGSNIGKALRLIEEDLRAETYKVENRAAARGQNDVYNMFTIIAMGREAIDLFTLVSTTKFQRMWKWQKRRALDEFGETFLKRRKRLKALQATSMIAELILTLDELLESGKNPGASNVITSVISGGTLETLRKVFADMQ